jgi:phage-related protein
MASPPLSTWVPSLSYVATLAGGVPINISFAPTEASDQVSFSADVVNTASLATTEARDLAAFAAEPVVTAALGATDAPDIAAFNAGSFISATLAATEPPDIAAFAAGQAVTATLAATDAPDVAAFVAGTLVSMSLAATEPRDAAAFAASPVVGVTVAATERRDSAAFQTLVAISAAFAGQERTDAARFSVHVPYPKDIIWPWCPQPGAAARSTQLAVDQTNYGDGYNHRATRGLHPARPSWSFSFPFTSFDELDAYHQFLKANADAGFWMRPPDSDVDVYMTADSWSATITDKNLASGVVGTLQATFVQQFNPQPLNPT